MILITKKISLFLDGIYTMTQGQSCSYNLYYFYASYDTTIAISVADLYGVTSLSPHCKIKRPLRFLSKPRCLPQMLHYQYLPLQQDFPQTPFQHILVDSPIPKAHLHEVSMISPMHSPVSDSHRQIASPLSLTPHQYTSTVLC